MPNLKVKNITTFIKKNYSDIKVGGMSTIFSKIRALCDLVVSILCIFAVNLIFIPIRLITPIIYIRIGQLISHRIGHLTNNVELYLCEKEFNLNKGHYSSLLKIDLFYSKYSPVCNYYLLKMWRKRIIVLPSFILRAFDLMLDKVSWGRHYQVGTNYQYDRDVKNLYDKLKPSLGFTDSEHLIGREALSAMGIPKDAKYICIIARDSAYLNKFFDGDFDYHNYRDSDIENYKLAIEYLLDEGYYVVRMGSVVRKKLIVPSHRFIDYATNGLRSEFLDLYLCAGCHFAVSGNTGLDGVPSIFRRPVAYVNFAPHGNLQTFRSADILLGKEYYKLSEKKLLGQQQIINEGLELIFDSQEFQDRGIEVRENSPEAIRDVCIEMHQKLAGDWLFDSTDLELQSRFWRNYPVNIQERNNGRKLHGDIRATYSSIYLRKNQHWFL